MVLIWRYRLMVRTRGFQSLNRVSITRSAAYFVMDKKYYLKVGKATDLKKTGDRILFRFFEIFPGFLTWGTIIGAVVLSWLKPFWAAIFIIALIFYWLFRTFYFSFHLSACYKEMREHEKINWLNKIKKLRPKESILRIKDWRDIYHLVILPMYKEPLNIVRDTLRAIEASDYPKDRLIVVLATEERAGRAAEETAKIIKKEFGDKFFRLLTTCHPMNLPNEIPGHGSNDAWAAKEAKKHIIDVVKIPYENVIVSSFDIDTCVYPKYFSCLTYYYLTSPKPTRTSFQPIPLYVNNIWQAPFISRLFAFSASFWQMMCQERPEKMLTFSSHAMSFKAMVDVGFKQANVISDDSRIFWQCFFQYDGDYQIKPLFYPVSMDANVAKTFWETMRNIYKQQQRWAYGVGDIPYFLFGFLKNKKISIFKKASLGFSIIEGHWSWATASVLIFFLGWLPLLLGGPEFSQTLFSYNLPRITSRILTVSMLGLVGSAYFSILLLPPKPPQYGRFKYLALTIEWFLLPMIMIFFTSLPAIDAQTRWMLGKYMGFWTTPKTRKL